MTVVGECFVLLYISECEECSMDASTQVERLAASAVFTSCRCPSYTVSCYVIVL